MTSALLFAAISSADSQQLSGEIQDIVEYVSGQDAFIVSLKDGDTEIAPKCIGIKDKEKGSLKYLNVEEVRIRYSLDMGWEFTGRIKLTCKDGKIIIEDMDFTE